MKLCKSKVTEEQLVKLTLVQEVVNCKGQRVIPWLLTEMLALRQKPLLRLLPFIPLLLTKLITELGGGGAGL